MTIKNGKIEVGTIVYKKVRLWNPMKPNADGKVQRYCGGYWEEFDPENSYHYEPVGHGIVKLVVLEEGVIPTKHRRGTKNNNRWEDGHRKCRIPRGYVAEIKVWNTYGDSKWTIATGKNFFRYSVGSVVNVPDYNNDPKICCTRGIHVFLTAAEAEAYSI